MTFSEAFIITLIGTIGLLMWLMIVATRVAMAQATKSAIKVMQTTRKLK